METDVDFTNQQLLVSDRRLGIRRVSRPLVLRSSGGVTEHTTFVLQTRESTNHRDRLEQPARGRGNTAPPNLHSFRYRFSRCPEFSLPSPFHPFAHHPQSSMKSLKWRTCWNFVCLQISSEKSSFFYRLLLLIWTLSNMLWVIWEIYMCVYVCVCVRVCASVCTCVCVRVKVEGEWC